MKDNLTPKQKHTQSRKEMVYREAIRLFVVHGYDETTIKMISEASGVSVGSIYHFYENKSAILAQYARNYLDTDAVSLLAEPTEANLRNPVDAIVDYYVKVSKQFEWIGVDLARKISDQYDGMWVNENGTYSNYYLPPNLLAFVERAQGFGSLAASTPAAEIVVDLQTGCSGVLFLWITTGGQFSLSQRLDTFLRRILQYYLPK